MKHIHTYTDGVDCRQSKIETSTLQPMQKKKTKPQHSDDGVLYNSDTQRPYILALVIKNNVIWLKAFLRTLRK